MNDRVAEFSSYIRRHQRADRTALLRAILDLWPDVTGRELQLAIDARKPTLVLSGAGAVTSCDRHEHRPAAS